MRQAGPQIKDSMREKLIERYRTIDGKTMSLMTAAGLNWLRTNQQIVNDLNVFPVPDGDTGTNMVLTMQAAWDEISSSGEESVGLLTQSIAHGALMGARGNSGVILSQLWRGFSRALGDNPLMDAELFVKALREARETAYKGVVRPVEGTILTVSTDVAIKAEEALANGASSALDILDTVVQAADDSVQRTPELLPVLKEAGVVDSGGLGFFYILEGMLRAAYRLPLDKPLAAVQPLSAISIQEAREAVEPDQDWEVVIDFQPKSLFDIQAFYGQLEKMGTSIQVGEGDGMYRMHIHVPDKTEYEPIEYVKSLGNITRVSMENLMAQMEEEEDGIHHLRLASVESGTNAAVTVAPGMGIARVFASLGAAAIIEGGQTMNPSTKEILDAFENLPTNKIIILPNNKNILLAARQAAELTVKKIAVIPSVSVPQGVSALLALDPNGDFKTTCQAMTKAIDEVQSAEITVATRSVEIDGVGVEEGQVIGIVNGRLAVAGDNLEQVLLDTLVTMKASEGELITLYYGEDLTAMQANQLADRVRENYPQQEVEVIEGGQPHYQLILSAE